MGEKLLEAPYANARSELAKAANYGVVEAMPLHGRTEISHFATDDEATAENKYRYVIAIRNLILAIRANESKAHGWVPEVTEWSKRGKADAAPTPLNLFTKEWLVDARARANSFVPECPSVNK